jgi:hypothetical protein
MLGAAAGESLVHLLAAWCRTVSLAEDLCNDEGEHIGRAAEPVNARRIDREVERPAEATGAKFRLDHAVIGVDLVLGLLVELP